MADKRHSEGSGAQFVQDENKSPEDSLLGTKALDLSSASSRSVAAEEPLVGKSVTIDSAGSSEMHNSEVTNKDKPTEKLNLNSKKQTTEQRSVTVLASYNKDGSPMLWKMPYEEFYGPKAYEKHQQKLTSASMFYRSGLMDDQYGGTSTAGRGKKGGAGNSRTESDKKQKLGPLIGAGFGDWARPAFRGSGANASMNDQFQDSVRNLAVLDEYVKKQLNKGTAHEARHDVFDPDDKLFLKSPGVSPIKSASDKQAGQAEEGGQVGEGAEMKTGEGQTTTDEKEIDQTGDADETIESSTKKNKVKKEESVIITGSRYFPRRRMRMKHKNAIKTEKVTAPLLAIGDEMEDDSDVRMSSPEKSTHKKRSDGKFSETNRGTKKSGDEHTNLLAKMKDCHVSIERLPEAVVKAAIAAGRFQRVAQEPEVTEAAQQLTTGGEQQVGTGQIQIRADPQTVQRTAQLQPYQALAAHRGGGGVGQGIRGGGTRVGGGLRARVAGRGGVGFARRGGFMCNTCGEHLPVGHHMHPQNQQVPPTGLERKRMRKSLVRNKKLLKISHRLEYEDAAHERRLERLNLRQQLKIERIRQRHNPALLAELDGQVVGVGEQDDLEPIDNLNESMASTNTSESTAPRSSVSGGNDSSERGASLTSSTTDSSGEEVVVGPAAMDLD